MFPESVFGHDVTMINSIVLTSSDEIVHWFEAAFVNDDSVFADPACGDGICSDPIEYPVWRESADHQGCEIDCGRWASDTAERNRRVRVQFTLDPTLSDAEIAAIRWNLVCPTVSYFEEQLK